MLLTPSPAAVQAASVPLSAVPPRAYIVGSYDGQELDLYVNGQLAASLPVRGHVDRAKTPLEIGAFLGHVIWAGAIDEVALYDRALAPSLISARYRLGVSPAPPGPTAYRDSVLGTPGLIGYWRLDDLGARALDQLGRNDGAYVGPVTRGFPGLISGETDHAAGFNGTGGYVTVPPARSLRVGRAFTLEAWVATAATDNRVILSRGGEYFLKTDQIGHWGVGVVIGGKIKSVYSTVLARAPLVDTATAGKPAFGAFWLVAIAALVASVWGLRRRQRGRSPRRRESPAAPHARRLPLIDSLRAIAALATHAGWYSGMNTSSAWGRYTEHLDAGVAIFFLISGLLLYRPFVLALDSLPAYLDQFALSNDGR